MQILSPKSRPPLFLSYLPSSAGETINNEQRKLICDQSVLIRTKGISAGLLAPAKLQFYCPSWYWVYGCHFIPVLLLVLPLLLSFSLPAAACD